MARYLDTGGGCGSACLGHWLQENVRPGVQGFRAQFGYFSYGAFEPFAQIVRDCAQGGHPVHLVLGSNNGALRKDDLKDVLRVVGGAPHATLTVVCFSNALFHPKVVHVVREDGSSTAIVGSANLTPDGIARNVEAAVILDEREGDGRGLLGQIAAAVERWAGVSVDGVSCVRGDDEVEELSSRGLIDVPGPPPAVPTSWGAGRRGLGRRRRLWTPAPSVVEPLAWSKRLTPSDAQEVRPGTNPTGKLRLSKAQHDIDHKTFFRSQMFGSLPWRPVVRHGKKYEVTDVQFDVTVLDRPLGRVTLSVDHAPHRVAGQNNVPTVLAWGPEVGQILRSQRVTGRWVVIGRDRTNRFSLTVRDVPPA